MSLTNRNVADRRTNGIEKRTCRDKILERHVLPRRLCARCSLRPAVVTRKEERRKDTVSQVLRSSASQRMVIPPASCTTDSSAPSSTSIQALRLNRLVVSFARLHATSRLDLASSSLLTLVSTTGWLSRSSLRFRLTLVLRRQSGFPNTRTRLVLLGTVARFIRACNEEYYCISDSLTLDRTTKMVRMTI